MTTSEHLIRTIARETQVSATTFDQPDIMRYITDELKQLIQEDAEQQHITITHLEIRTAPDFTTGEDGVWHQFYRVAAVAQGFMRFESAKQTLRKIDIANAQSDWTEDD
jgi:hypothetical protein